MDDLEAGLNKQGFAKLRHLVTITSHHTNTSILYLGHSLFSKNMREISLQFQRYFLTNQYRDKAQIMALGRQVYPSNVKYLQNVYEDVLRIPYNNLLLDFSPNRDTCLRTTSGYFIKNKPIVVYKPL